MIFVVRPEPNVYIEKGCMLDFKYINTLLPLNDEPTKRSMDLRVLHEGTQCRLFGGTYGIPRGKGRGVIALEDIAKGTLIFEYAGDKILQKLFLLSLLPSIFRNVLDLIH